VEFLEDLKIQINKKKCGLWESYHVLLDFEVLTAGLQRDIILLKAMRVA
jgi:hypothetical protein